MFCTDHLRATSVYGASLCALVISNCASPTLGTVVDAASLMDAHVAADLAAVLDANSTPDAGGADLPDLGAPVFVDLIVIQGESNAGGKGLNSDANEAELQARPIVQILNNDNLLFEALDIGTNNNLGQNSDQTTTEHGFELGLANEVEAGHLGAAPVYLVKCGKSGARIKDWLAGSVAGYWENCVERIDAAEAALDSLGLTHRITVWQSIGLNDLYSEEYFTVRDMVWPMWEADMEAFKAQFRARYGSSILFLTTQFRPEFFVWNFVFDDMAASDPLQFVISEPGATRRDDQHWDYGGLKTLASRFVVAMNP